LLYKESNSAPNYMYFLNSLTHSKTGYPQKYPQKTFIVYLVY
jgi:hypothetical protein